MTNHNHGKDARTSQYPIPIYSTEEDNDEYDLTELERDELARLKSEELRSIIKDGLIDAETEDFINKELYIREQRMYPEPQGDPSY